VALSIASGCALPVLADTPNQSNPATGAVCTPTPTPPPDALAVAMCGTPTPTPTFPPFPLAAPTGAATPGAVPPLTLRVGNPSPGATVSAGMYMFQGVAFDPAAQGASGVDTSRSVPITID
jgi:hypothetical protein